MTEQEIKAVLTAQAHIRARKRAVIHMALGEMEAALERSGVFIREDVWAGYCRQSLAMLLPQDCAEDPKGRVATIAKVLAENPQYLGGCVREPSTATASRVPTGCGGCWKRRRGSMRFRACMCGRCASVGARPPPQAAKAATRSVIEGAAAGVDANGRRGKAGGWQSRKAV